MTMIRRIAIGIAVWVSEFSVPRGQEWALASASEVVDIPGDWAALRWALGSVRLVFQRSQTDEGSRAAFHGSLWFQLFIWLPQLLTCVPNIFKTTNSLSERIGWGMMALGSGWWCGSTFLDRLRERSAPPWRDFNASRSYALKQLQRRLRRYRSVWRWSSPLVTICSCSGYLMACARPGHSPIFASLVVAFGAVAIWMQCLETPERIQERIDRLEERMAEKRS